MMVYIHNDCGEPAVERPDTVLPEIPAGFPFICLSCLGEVEDATDLTAVQLMSQ